MKDGVWKWFLSNRARLEGLPSEDLVEAFSEILSNPRLGVEVADSDGWEVVFTAGGDASMFGVVKEIVASAPKMPGWTFVALKKARGFRFSIKVGLKKIDAAQLLFQPLESEHRPDELGILLLVSDPNADLDALNEIAWLIIETGIGEEAAARIAYLEVCHLTDQHSEALPVTSLGDYIQWHISGVASNEIT